MPAEPKKKLSKTKTTSKRAFKEVINVDYKENKKNRYLDIEDQLPLIVNPIVEEGYEETTFDKIEEFYKKVHESCKRPKQSQEDDESMEMFDVK